MGEPSRTAANRVLAGRYRLVQAISRGGMAEVWEAHDQILARPVAVKVLHPHLAADEGFLDRFRTEAVSAARLVHPNVVSIFDTGSDGDTAFIVMELVRGEALGQVLHHEGALGPRRAVDIATQVADALHYAHRAGIVHRDVKPANILLCDDGRVKVADFGIAKVARPDDVTRTGTVLGTVAYLSPEQVEGGEVDARTDIYALGLVLYEMLCGRPPFSSGSDVGTALLRLQTVPPRPRQVRAGIPRPLETVTLTAIARLPADRYATAAELATALRSVDLRGDDAAAMVVRDATPPGGVPLAVRRVRRSWLVPSLVFLLVAAAIAASVVAVTRSRGTHGPKRETAEASTTTTGPPSIARASVFNPEGGSDEHSDRAAMVLDGLPTTAWSTFTYRTSRFGNLKSGVGLVFALQSARRLERLAVTSPTVGWAAEVHVAAAPAGSIEGWGSPVDQRSGISGPATFDLRRRSGGAVLLWITDLGPQRKVQVSEVRVEA